MYSYQLWTEDGMLHGACGRIYGAKSWKHAVTLLRKQPWLQAHGVKQVIIEKDNGDRHFWSKD